MKFLSAASCWNICNPCTNLLKIIVDLLDFPEPISSLPTSTGYTSRGSHRRCHGFVPTTGTIVRQYLYEVWPLQTCHVGSPLLIPLYPRTALFLPTHSLSLI